VTDGECPIPCVSEPFRDLGQKVARGKKLSRVFFLYSTAKIHKLNVRPEMVASNVATSVVDHAMLCQKVAPVMTQSDPMVWEIVSGNLHTCGFLL
jgi:hypothetical protein